MLRTGHKGLAAATLLLDALKGVVAVLIAASSASSPAVGAAAGAVLGHMFPVWLCFKGGKGVATTLGVMWGLSWPVGAIACAAWLAVRRDLPLLLAGRAAQHRGRRDRRLVPDRSPGGHAAHACWCRWCGRATTRTSRRLLDGTEPKIGQRTPTSGT